MRSRLPRLTEHRCGRSSDASGVYRPWMPALRSRKSSRWLGPGCCWPRQRASGGPWPWRLRFRPRSLSELVALPGSKRAVGAAVVVVPLVTAAFWYWLGSGSWHDTRPNGPGKNSGCAAFHRRLPTSGRVYAPDPDGITVYSDGYHILNWASFDFQDHQGNKEVAGVGGTATIWMNPFSRSLTLRYKVQSQGGPIRGG